MVKKTKNPTKTIVFVKKVQKRDGTIVLFNEEKIVFSLFENNNFLKDI